MKKSNTIEFIEKAKKVHGDRYDYSHVNYVDANTRVYIKCKKHGLFSQTPYSHLSGFGCKECGFVQGSIKRKLSLDNFIKKSKDVHGDKYDYSLVEYKGNKINVYIICPEHGIFQQTPSTHLRGGGCRKCAKKILGDIYRHNKQDFIKKSKKVHGDRYDYSLVEYKGNKEKVDIICKEHGVFRQTPANHISGKQGCPRCCKNYKSSLEVFINKANIVHDNKYTYNNFVYIRAVNKSWITCSKHGDFLQSAQKHLSGKGCPSCCNSKMENIVENILKENRINFNLGFKDFDWLRTCKKGVLELDFYLPDYNIAIECQGEQHFKPVRWSYNISESDAKENLKQIKKRDKIKKELCEKHGVRLFYINYNENTEESLNNIIHKLKSNNHD